MNSPSFVAVSVALELLRCIISLTTRFELIRIKEAWFAAGCPLCFRRTAGHDAGIDGSEATFSEAEGSSSFAVGVVELSSDTSCGCIIAKSEG